MKTASIPLFVGSAALAAGGILFAQSPSSNPPAEPAATPAAERSSLSPKVTSTVAASLPAYKPVAPTPAKVAADTAKTAADNDITRLPEVVIESPRSELNEGNTYSGKGLAERARQRYLNTESEHALNAFTLPLLGRRPEERALERQREEVRKEQLAESRDAVATLALTDPEAAARLRTELHQTFFRSDSFALMSPMSPGDY